MGTREPYTDVCPLHRLGPGRDQPAEKTGEWWEAGENAHSPETQRRSCAASFTPKSSLCLRRFKMLSREI